MPVPRGMHRAALQCQHCALALDGASGEQQGESCSEQSLSRATLVTELASPWHSTQRPAWDRRLLSSWDSMQCKAVN